MKVMEEFADEIIGENKYTQFYQIPQKIMVHDKLTPGAKLLYGVLLSYSYLNLNTTNEQLSNIVKVSIRQIQNYLKELEENKVISIKIENKNKRWVTPLITNAILINSSPHSKTKKEKAKQESIKKMYDMF